MGGARGLAFVDFLVSMPVEHLQSVLVQAFWANGFQVGWHGPWAGKAQKGSLAANVVAGALAQYYAVEFQVFPGSWGSTLRIVKGNTGLFGGIIGYAMVDSKFAEVANGLQAWFHSNRVLAGVQRG